MKDLKLIETIVVTYFHENKDIDGKRLKEILTDSLNIEIGNVKLDENILKVYFGPKNKRKKIIFEIQKDKIKKRKDV